MSFRSGFVAIIGRPNVGKSTLINYLAEAKVAIVTNKPQTTRHAIRCIINRRNAQMILIDTPGFHKPKHKLGSALNERVMQALNEVDVVLFMVDASSGVGAGDVYLAKMIAEVKASALIGLNKIDLIDDQQLMVEQANARALDLDAPVFPISGKNGAGVKVLIDDIITRLPEGPKYYPDEMLTDQPELLVMSELIREKIMELTHEEIPHSVAVVVEETRIRENKNILDVEAIVYVERESQKRIVIGKQGALLKKAGERSRLEIENLFGTHVNLQLWVKVKKDWRDSEAYVRGFGY